MKRLLTLAVISLISLTAFTGCKGSMYEKSESNYTPVTTVKAANFEVPTGFLMKATAISSISDSEEYDGIYVYKDGVSKYILFDTSSVVIACGPTSFGFEGNESEETLESKSIEGIWLTSPDGKFNSSSGTNNGVYKIISENIDAQFSITPTQYCTLKGAMASCSDGSNEYSIFAGAVVDENNSDLTNDQKDIIDHIVKNFSLNENAEPVDVVDDQENANSKTEDATTDTTEVNASVEDSENTSEVSEDIDIADTEGTSESETVNPEEAPAVDVVVETDPSDNEVSDTNDTEKAENANKDSEETAESDSGLEETEVATDIAEDNTEEIIEAKPVEPKESTVYNPLTIGDWGYAGCFGDSHEELMNAVHIDNIYTGDEAMDLIKKHGGRKTTPLTGTSFAVVEYTTTQPSDAMYLNLRFCGVDGQRLVLRGISYTTRTYDLDNTEQIGSNYDIVTYEKRYAYFEIPTGCKEYMLVFGERVAGVEDIPNANFLIKIK